jgi:hypothetical protein
MRWTPSLVAASMLVFVSLGAAPARAEVHVFPGVGLGWERFRSWGVYGDGIVPFRDDYAFRIGADVGLRGAGGTVGFGRIATAGHPALPIAAGIGSLRVLHTWRDGPSRTFVGGELLGHLLLAGVTASALCNVADASFELGLGVRLGLP